MLQHLDGWKGGMLVALMCVRISCQTCALRHVCVGRVRHAYGLYMVVAGVYSCECFVQLTSTVWVCGG
ncbi:MAG: hypothetical protein ACK559_24665, partial [bacterium]